MKKFLPLIRIIILYLLINSGLPVEGSTFLSGGVSRGRYLDSGENGNYFDYGIGYCLEFGLVNSRNNFSWVVYGISGSQHKNYVGSSVADASFFTPYYTELRFNLLDNINLFLIIGFDWNRVQFYNTDGADNQYLLTTGLGSYINISEKFFIQPKIKPYLILGNCLDQQYGITMQLNIGLYFNK